jgi:hypothetical protein
MTTKPDFSGEWTLNRQACTLSPGADAIRTGVVRIEHRDPKFRYQASFVSDTGTVQSEFELMSEEREAAGTEQEMTNGASLRWEGDALVFIYAGGGLKITFRYELMDAGRRLQAVEQLRGNGRTQDNIWIFDRSCDSREAASELSHG